jgi:glucosamine--fructose-6-phosphate aminotransferase (isomerizing)
MINQIILDDITAQPWALTKSLAGMRAQVSTLIDPDQPSKRVIFTGSGDSLWAPMCMQYLGRGSIESEIYVIPPMEAAEYWKFTPDDLVVVISFSGNTRRTVEAAKAAVEQGSSTIGITNNNSSSLAKSTGRILELPSYSKSRSIPHTVDYILTLLAVALIVERLARFEFDRLSNLPDLMKKTTHALIQPCLKLGEALVSNQIFFFLGAGPSYGTAMYAAAKLWEACGIHGFGFELEEFAHGPHKLVAAGDPVFLLAPLGPSLEYSLKVCEGLKTLGAVPYLVTNEPQVYGIQNLSFPEIREDWSPFLTCIPVQLLTWAIASARGYDVVVGEGRVKNIRLVREVQRSWIR